MDALVSLLGTLAVETGRFVCGSAYSTINNVFKFQVNIIALEKEMASLILVKDGIMEELDMAKLYGNLPTSQVRSWLRKVEEIEGQVILLQGKIKDNKESHLSCCSGHSSRYRLSRNVATKIKMVTEAIKEGSFPEGVFMVNSRVSVVEQLPGPSIISQKKASENLKKVLDLLMDDGVGTIGIWGMGGVGKTTLMINLNNKLERSIAEQPFSVVIWVTVSKDVELQRVQDRIASRLQLKKINGEFMDDTAVRLLSRLNLERKFLLILDDVWERIDLEKIGVPPCSHGNGSKIILTTRSREVCGEMKTDVDYKVELLNEDEAWKLFVENTGIVDLDHHIMPIARDVAKECCGLPLAIITVGRAMRRKKQAELWKDALRVLRDSSSVPSIKGLEKEVFLPLKWSYDSLESKNVRHCFLYCCLYPEDFSINEHELIQCWIAEGLIGKQEKLDDEYNSGMTLIDTLISSCMLEWGHKAGTIRMHDVLRDLAIWISNTAEVVGNKSLVRAGIGLRHVPEMEPWDSLKRVSFMENDIGILPEIISQCSEVSTLLLQGNSMLKVVPESFVQGFGQLRVLNLSSTGIISMPVSLAEGGDIRVLRLSHCSHIRDISSLGGLTRLEMLDLSHSTISRIPIEIGKLIRLRHLNLSYTTCLEHISTGTFSGLSSLEVLDMRFSKFPLDIPKSFNKDSATLVELVSLAHLEQLCFSVKYSWTGLEGSHILERLKRFYIAIGSGQSKYFIPYSRKTVFIGQEELDLQIDGCYLRYANGFVFEHCNGDMADWWRRHHGFLTNLRFLAVSSCEVMNIFNGSNSTVSMDTYVPHNWFDKLHNLRQIEVSDCPTLQELVSGFNGPEPVNALRNLRVLKLNRLPMLSCICNGVMLWPFIEHIEVRSCPGLKKLPLCAQHENTIQMITGKSYWWRRLQWQDDYTESVLQKYFKPVDQEV